MARLWTNSIRGTLTSDDDTTLTADIFAELPAVSSPDTLRLTLDPQREKGLGKPEIVEVTDHSASSKTVTVTRAVETGNNGASKTSWPAGTTVVHAYTAGEADDVTTHRDSTSNPHNTSVDGLTDVDASGVSDGQALTFDSGASQWVPGDIGSQIVEDVTDHGATGDGATDDTSAIKSAVDAVGAAGGGIVFFPPGTYLMSMVRVEHPNVHIVGAGRGATTLLMAADGGSTITFGHFDDTSVRGTVEYVSIRSLTVDGNKSAHSNDDQNPGLTTEDVVDCLFFDLRVVDTAGYGIGIVGTDQAHRDEMKLSHIDILRPNQDGVDIKPGLPTCHAEHVRVRDAGPVSGHASTGFDLRVSNYAHLACCIAENCDTHGFEADEESGGEYVFVGCRAANATVGEGFRVNAGDATFVACYAINNRAGFLADSAASSHFDRCVAYNNTEAGIDAEATTTVGSDRVTIDGCEVFDNATGGDGRGVLIGDVAKWRIANSIIRPGPNANQERGINFTNSAPAGVLVGNDIQGHSDVDINNRPSGTASAANLIGTES